MSIFLLCHKCDHPIMNHPETRLSIQKTCIGLIVGQTCECNETQIDILIYTVMMMKRKEL
jgi:hypothetical protein